MLTTKLQEAVQSLNSLIEITNIDMDNIKNARHTALFTNTSEKNKLLENFDECKAFVSEELYKIKVANGELSLTEQQGELMEEMKTKLAHLKELNKNFAKLVLTVSEFYNSLLGRLLPTESNGYSSMMLKSASLLKVRV
jgi:hypothetical protein